MTTFSYNALDLVTSINYNNDKQVTYAYNGAGDLVEMKDWLGETTFEVDLLHQITKTTDHKGKAVDYTYDAVGNQTSVGYPDGQQQVIPMIWLATWKRSLNTAVK